LSVLKNRPSKRGHLGQKIIFDLDLRSRSF
jgi:hypothetical protein